MKGGILILGHTGYIGSAFRKHISEQGLGPVMLPHSREDYTSFSRLRAHLNVQQPALVINCAAFLAGGTVSNCDNFKAETIMTNAVLPKTITNACELEDIPLIHISTGCLYDEEREYDETDPPLRGFDGHCGTYVGSKLLAEQAVSEYAGAYILRIRLPFDESNNPRNYLNKLAGFETIYDHTNSLTHRGDFVKQALELWRIRAPFGIYNMACVGQVEAWDVMALLMKKNIITKVPEMQAYCTTFGSRLSVQKLIDTGIKVRHVEEAVDEAIRNYV